MMLVLRRLFGGLCLYVVCAPLLLVTVLIAFSSHALYGSMLADDVPRKIAQQLPPFVDHILAVSKRPKAVRQPDAKAWIKAVSSSEKPPSYWVQQLKLSEWLRVELSRVVRDVQKGFRGTLKKKTIYWDNKGLKQALHSKAFRDYLHRVLAKIPACRPEQNKEWQAMIMRERRHLYFPTCNPEQQVAYNTAHKAIADAIVSVIRIPKREVVLYKSDFKRVHLLSKPFAMMGWWLLLFPLLMMALSAWIMSVGRRWAIRHVSVAVMLVCAAPLLFLKTIQAELLRRLLSNPWVWELWAGFSLWSVDAQREFMRGLLPLLVSWMQPFFSSLSSVLMGLSGLAVLGLLASSLVSEKTS